MQLKAAALFKYIWPFSRHQALVGVSFLLALNTIRTNSAFNFNIVFYNLEQVFVYWNIFSISEFVLRLLVILPQKKIGNNFFDALQGYVK